MSKKQMTLVYYYVPQDQDDEETPNVFGVMVGKNNIRLHHLYQHFPLKGQYIFRFKVMYDNTIAWLDLPQLDTKLPTFKDKIVIKATRISWQSDPNNLYGHYRFIKKQGQTSATREQTQPQKTSTVNTSNQQQQSSNQKQSMKQSQATDLLSEKHQTPTSGNKVQTSDLLGDRNENKPASNNNTIPQDFNFDLLQTSSNSTTNNLNQKNNTSNNSSSGTGGNIDLSGLIL